MTKDWKLLNSNMSYAIVRDELGHGSCGVYLKDYAKNVYYITCRDLLKIAYILIEGDIQNGLPTDSCDVCD